MKILVVKVVVIPQTISEGIRQGGTIFEVETEDKTYHIEQHGDVWYYPD